AADLEPSVPGVDTLYVADETTNAGILKFSLVNNTWVYNGNVTFSGKGARGLTAQVNGGIVTIYASDTATSDNTIWKVIDTSGWNHTLSVNQVTPFNSG